MSPQASPPAPLPFGTRFWFAWACFFRVFFDGRFAADCFAARTGTPVLPPPPPPELPPPARAPNEAALQLLALFQREGRLVDFLEQDVTAFPDVEIGAAARVVHEGCRKALHAHARLVPVREEEEGTRVTLPKGFSPSEVKLSGNVAGSGPYTGTLRHRGWRVVDLSLAQAVAAAANDLHVVAPAEVEL